MEPEPKPPVATIKASVEVILFDFPANLSSVLDEAFVARLRLLRRFLQEREGRADDR